MPSTYSGEARNNGPKLTVYKAVNKFVIASGVPIDKKINIFYVWEPEKTPELDDDGMPIEDFIMVDYDKYCGTWYLNYVSKYLRTIHAQIDDLTGRVDLTNVN